MSYDCRYNLKFLNGFQVSYKLTMAKVHCYFQRIQCIARRHLEMHLVFY